MLDYRNRQELTIVWGWITLKQEKNDNLHCTTPLSSAHSCPLGHVFKELNTWQGVVPEEIETAV